MAKACAYLCRQCCFIDGFGEFGEFGEFGNSDQRSVFAATCNLGTTVSPRLQMTSLTIRVTQFIQIQTLEW